jgi:sugar phosphate isomerase/epimerase
MNNVYLSTGAFTGRRNGRNHRLAIEYQSKLQCDGYEVIIFDDWYDRLDTIIADYNASKLSIPIVHVDKTIGNYLSNDNTYRVYDLLKINCDAAKRMGAKEIVVHIWGIPYSDKKAEIIYNRVNEIVDISKSYDLEMLIENSPSICATPLEHLEALKSIYPDVGFTIDTRFCEFFKQLEDVCKSGIWSNVRHIHISDYHGEYMDWSLLYPILQPTHGDVDFDMFFDYLKKINYSGSFTLESPSILENSVDYETLNRSLGYIKDKL